MKKIKNHLNRDTSKKTKKAKRYVIAIGVSYDIWKYLRLTEDREGTYGVCKN